MFRSDSSHDGHVSGQTFTWPHAAIPLVVRGDVDADFVVERAKHAYVQVFWEHRLVLQLTL